MAALGFEVSLIAGVEPVKRATAVSSRAAKMEERPLGLVDGFTRPLGGALAALQRSHLNCVALF